MILSKGDHLVKITRIQEGRSEFKGTPYFLLRFENSTGFIDQRIYENYNNAKFISKLFDAVDLAFNDLIEWKLQIASLIGTYLLITVVENVRDDIKDKEVKYLAVYKFNHVSKKYSYYSEECYISGEYEYGSHQFQTYADDELVPADIKRKYFTSFERGQYYAFLKYNEIAYKRYGLSDLDRIFEPD